MYYTNYEYEYIVCSLNVQQSSIRRFIYWYMYELV